MSEENSILRGKVTHIQWLLGDKLTQDAWYEDNEHNADWIEAFKRDARQSMHPLVKIVTTEYMPSTEPEVTTPTNPSTLWEVVGD